MKLAGRLLVTVLGLLVVWFAVTMAASPDLIIPIPEHGAMPERIEYEPTLVSELSRYAFSALLGFFGLTLALAPWRNRRGSS